MINVSRDGWTREALDRLRELWGTMSGERVAAALHTSKSSVFGKAHRIGLPPMPSPIKGGGPKRSHHKPAPTPPRVTLQSFGPTPARNVVFLPPQSEPCVYVVTENRPHRYCEAPGIPGSPYCAEHHQRCHLKAPPARADGLLDRSVVLFARAVR